MTNADRHPEPSEGFAECRTCGALFKPVNLRQVHCRPSCARSDSTRRVHWPDARDTRPGRGWTISEEPEIWRWR
jgi:hypothetical protein